MGYGRAFVDVNVLLDSGSELNIMSTKLFRRIGSQGTAVQVNIVGVGGGVLKKRVMKTEIIIKDHSGLETTIECVVLDEPCGKLAKPNQQIVEAIKKEVIGESEF